MKDQGKRKRKKKGRKKKEKEAQTKMVCFGAAQNKHLFPGR